MGKTFSTGATFIYPIGDFTNYTPLNLNINAVTNSSTIDASTVGTDNPDTTAGTSGIEATKSVNRYFSLTNNGLTFGSYDAVFNFVSGDLDSGASAVDMTLAKKTDGEWATLSTTCTTTACTTTGLTSMSDFQIGVVIPSSSGDSSSSTSTSPIVSVLKFIQKVLKPSPTVSPEPPPLFDIISSPLFTKAGSVKLFLVIGFTFLGGSLIGIGLLAVRRRRRGTRVLRISRRRHI